jgi:phospholipase A1
MKSRERDEILGGLVATVVAGLLSGALSSTAFAEEADAPPTVVAAEMVDRPMLGRLIDLFTFHRSNYFASGIRDETQVKFQVSFKYDLWPNETSHHGYFAFTQRSLWNLWNFDDSSPFEENNYGPEVFYGYQPETDRLELPEGCGLFLARLGFHHESNGESDERSRSWNRAVGEMEGVCRLGTANFVHLALRAWPPPFGTDDNRDISQFMGYGELTLRYGRDGLGTYFGTFDADLTARKGSSSERDRGSLQLHVRAKPSYASFLVPDWWRFTPDLVFDAFWGYGETLLRYDRNVTSFRVGVAFRENFLRTPPT